MPTTLSFRFGKRPRRPTAVNLVAGGKLLHVQDEESGMKLLVDTGAEVSLIPPTPHDRKFGKTSIALTAANGSAIRTYGKPTLTLHLASRTYRWPFTIAEVSRSILVADFLRYHSFLVDLQRQRIVHAETFESVPAHQA